MKRNSWNDCLSGSWGLSPDSHCHWIVFMIFASLGPNFFLHETGLDYTIPPSCCFAVHSTKLTFMITAPLHETRAFIIDLTFPCYR